MVEVIGRVGQFLAVSLVVRVELEMSNQYVDGLARLLLPEAGNPDGCTQHS